MGMKKSRLLLLKKNKRLIKAAICNFTYFFTGEHMALSRSSSRQPVILVFTEHSIAQVVEALNHNTVLGWGEVYLEFPFFHRAFLLYVFIIYRKNAAPQMCDFQSERIWLAEVCINIYL